MSKTLFERGEDWKGIIISELERDECAARARQVQDEVRLLDREREYLALLLEERVGLQVRLRDVVLDPIRSPYQGRPSVCVTVDGVQFVYHLASGLRAREQCPQCGDWIYSDEICYPAVVAAWLRGTDRWREHSCSQPEPPTCPCCGEVLGDGPGIDGLCRRCQTDTAALSVAAKEEARARWERIWDAAVAIRGPLGSMAGGAEWILPEAEALVDEWERRRNRKGE